MLNDIIRCLPSRSSAEFNLKRINWLKSLRPQLHWKPSEEQMEALKWQIKNTYDGSWQRKESESLYNDLKKL